jgi:uncharacterized protein
MYPKLGLTLMMTHACNLQCSYCYTGAKRNRFMSVATGRAAIDRAVASLLPAGTLGLGFFGGEPLLRAAAIKELAAHALRRTRASGMHLSLAVTTNGTVTTPDAWSVMMMPQMDLSISCDGLPEVHDRHRRTTDGGGSVQRVLSTIGRLLAASQSFRVVIVVRPDTLEALPDSITFLQQHGVRTIHPSLDVWAHWGTRDVRHLERVIAECARLWRLGLPHLSITWFDEKAGLLAGMPAPAGPRCGFGDGEIAVAPSGRLYPCERLIGADAIDNSMALPGHVTDGLDFLDMPRTPPRSHSACDACAMRADCNTTCRCSNYIRTGDVSRPDGLLCAFNQACLVQTARVLNEPIPASTLTANQGERHDNQ